MRAHQRLAHGLHPRPLFIGPGHLLMPLVAPLFVGPAAGFLLLLFLRASRLRFTWALWGAPLAFLAWPIDWQVGQEVMGHSKIQTTYDVYGHLLPGSYDDVRARMDALSRGRCVAALGEHPRRQTRSQVWPARW